MIPRCFFARKSRTPDKSDVQLVLSNKRKTKAYYIMTGPKSLSGYSTALIFPVISSISIIV